MTVRQYLSDLGDFLEPRRIAQRRLIAERDRYREAAQVFAHYYDAICDELKGTDLAYLRARGCLNERLLAARKALEAAAPMSSTGPRPKRPSDHPGRRWTSSKGAAP